jgi:hypothetical protein
LNVVKTNLLVGVKRSDFLAALFHGLRVLGLYNCDFTAKFGSKSPSTAIIASLQKSRIKIVSPQLCSVIFKNKPYEKQNNTLPLRD